jgi:hypothetical protein
VNVGRKEIKGRRKDKKEIKILIVKMVFKNKIKEVGINAKNKY